MIDGVVKVCPQNMGNVFGPLIYNACDLVLLAVGGEIHEVCSDYLFKQEKKNLMAKLCTAWVWVSCVHFDFN